MTERIYNFSAGPAVLPVPVLEEAQRDMIELARRRHERDGDQPSLENFRRDHRRAPNRACANCWACRKITRCFFCRAARVCSFR